MNPDKVRKPNGLLFFIRFLVAVYISCILVGVGLVLIMSIIGGPVGILCLGAAGRITGKCIEKYHTDKITWDLRDVNFERKGEELYDWEK